MKLCFASHNANKLREVRQLVPDRIEVVGLDELGVTQEIPETGSTMEENSMIKARYVFDQFGMAVFADDSGLEIDSLGGEPGVYSARYAGEEKNSEANMDLVLSRMEGARDRKARFKAVITFIDDLGGLSQFVGTVEGSIGYEKIGAGGFGYDPIFFPDGYDKTFAQMTSAQKNQMSHRARALSKFLEFIRSV